MQSALIIGIITIIVFISSVIFIPSVSLKGKRVKIYPIVPILGALCMIMAKVIPFGRVIESFLENTSVNPIKILVLFLSMTVFSLILEQTGFFSYASSYVLRKAGKSQYKIFIELYCVISLLTVFTSNDIVILTFTPFICYFSRSAKINPIPYLIMEFVAANTWSLLLMIGNPTNIYISSSFEIGFVEYFKAMVIPTVAAGLSSLLIMLLLFGKSLKKDIDSTVEQIKLGDKPLMIISIVHLLICVLSLAISQYLGLEMWLISFVCAISEIVCSLICLRIRRKEAFLVWHGLGSMPFEIIPFIIGMFVIVLALDHVGITALIADHISSSDKLISYGYLSFFSSNVLNNIPMSVFFSKIIAADVGIEQIYATIAGSNLGAFITPVGALAGIMWMNLLKQNSVELSVKKFVFYGFIIGVPSMTAVILSMKLLF